MRAGKAEDDDGIEDRSLSYQTAFSSATETSSAAMKIWISPTGYSGAAPAPSSPCEPPAVAGARSG